MHKIKQLKPSAREKKRYLAFEVISKNNLKKEAFPGIIDGIKRNLGLFSAGNAGIMPVTFDQKTQRGIIKMGHKYVNKVRVSMMLMNQQTLTITEDGDDYLIKTLSASGTINTLEQHYFAS
ncbi:MAG: Rpp14/Pop5 family protein [Nanoarchaeota archaeon]